MAKLEILSEALHRTNERDAAVVLSLRSRRCICGASREWRLGFFFFFMRACVAVQLEHVSSSLSLSCGHLRAHGAISPTIRSSQRHPCTKDLGTCKVRSDTDEAGLRQKSSLMWSLRRKKRSRSTVGPPKQSGLHLNATLSLRQKNNMRLMPSAIEEPRQKHRIMSPAGGAPAR